SSHTDEDAGRVEKDEKLFPVNDVCGFPFSALLGVGAEGHQIIIAVLARETVDVRVAPGVERNVLPQIWTVPVLEVARTRPKSLQALLCRRIVADIQLVCIEHR